MSNYVEQYRDPRWQKKRLEILQRDNFQCQYCAAKDKTLHVHHLGYDIGYKIWEQPNLSMITLCESCHENEQFQSKYALQQLTKCLQLFLGSSSLYTLDEAFYEAFADCEKGKNNVVYNRPSVLVLLCCDLVKDKKLQEIVLKYIREKTDMSQQEAGDSEEGARKPNDTSE